MHPNQVYSQLLDKGFRVDVEGSDIFAGLNRRVVSTMEVAIALDCEQSQLKRVGDRVQVLFS